MKNRIAILRKEKGLTLDQVQKDTGINRVTISQYERGKREPRLDTWERLADYFTVPVEYLQGYSDDRIGWHLWEEATGYSRSTIEFQIKELIETGKLSANDDIQKQIGKACEYLDGRGKTDHNAVMYARQGLYDLLNHIHDDFYLDPKKVKNEYGNSPIKNMKKDYDGSLYYDDMDKQVYDDIQTIFQETLDKLAYYIQTHKFKK